MFILSESTVSNLAVTDDIIFWILVTNIQKILETHKNHVKINHHG